MRTRQEIKEYAKGAFAAQRSACILGLFLVMLLTVGFVYFGNIPNIMINFSFFIQDFDIVILGIIAVIGVIVSLLAIPVAILSYVLTVNVSGFFVKVYYGQPVKYSEPYYEIRNNFGRKLGGMLWVALWLYLWSLAFMAPAMIVSIIAVVGFVASNSYGTPFFAILIPFAVILLSCIPIIIKSLSYSMTQYILASNPNVLATNAIKLSIRMTKGHKGKIFGMWMSFVGWQLLNILTFGILGIIYVNPYMYASFAGQFVELRSLAVASGVIHPLELDGVPPEYMQSHQYNQAYGYYQPQPQYPSDPYHQQPPPQPQYLSDPYHQQPPPAQPYAPHYIPEPPSDEPPSPSL